MIAFRHAALSALLVLACARLAHAQGGHLFAAGAGYSVTQLNGDSWRGSPNWFIFRLPRPEHLGIAWDIGSDTFPVPADATPSQAAGSLLVRHFLFGPGYTLRAGRVELTISGLVGPVTNKFELDESPRSPASATLSSKTTWGGLVGGTSYIDMVGNLGLKLSADYVLARPTLIGSVDGSSTTWKARRVRTQVGIVYGFY